MKYNFGIPCGSWSVPNGLWSPNLRLTATEEEQHAANVKNGYSCQCGYIKNNCKCSEPNKTGVHASHCCVLHGCKYGDADCPVENGRIKQQYTCEECEFDGITSLDDIKKIVSGSADLCPHNNVRTVATSPISLNPTYGICIDCGKEVKATTTWEVDDGTR